MPIVSTIAPLIFSVKTAAVNKVRGNLTTHHVDLLLGPNSPISLIVFGAPESCFLKSPDLFFLMINI